MKNFYILYILCLLCIFALAGCHEKDPIPELTVGQTEYTLGAVEGRTATVTFKTNVEWTIAVSYEGTDTDWLTATPASGSAGENTLELTAKENTGEGPRTATISIMYGGKNQELDILQTGPELTVGQTEYTLGAVEGRTATVSFNTNVEWTLSVSYEGSETDWLTATPTSGTAGENTVEMTAGENDGEAARTAYVDIMFGVKTTRINITQTGMSDTTDITSLFDPEFARILKEKGYIPDAEKILPKDVAGITYLDISGPSSSNPGFLISLKGIEYFESLEVLYCDNNQLTDLDVRNNTLLTTLWCSDNQLTTLDVSKNTLLEDLHCYNNQLTDLDVRNNTQLTCLYCSSNQLTLDVRNNTQLTDLDCRDNQLTTLDVKNNYQLTCLYCSDNQLTALDISNNTLLKRLWCSDNQLTTLDVSKNTLLKDLQCDFNQLTVLDVSNNTHLTGLDCYRNQLTDLDVRNNTQLEDLRCRNNQLTTLDVSKNTLLTRLWCDFNQLTTLDVSKNTLLEDLQCDFNQLTTLDVSKNIQLTTLFCENNQLTALDVSKNTLLTRLRCNGNPGDGISVFPVTAWFGNDAIPSDFTEGSWTYGNNTITIDYRKAE